MKKEAAEIKQFYPDKNALLILRLFVILSEAVLLYLLHRFIPVRMIFISAAMIITFIAIIAIFVYLPMFFASIRYTANDLEIIKTSGVYIKRHQAVRYESIQYTSVVTTPLSHRTGLNFVIFYVYGGKLRLSFLNVRDANEILSMSGSVSEGGQSNVS